jgi:arylsulfatase A-like enzyme
MRSFLKFAVWLLVAASTAERCRLNAAPASRPNILYILADDMGIGDVSALNPRSAWKTPNIDRLAREGRSFTDAHSASGVCTPSRYTLLTGRYSWRGSLKSNVLHGYDSSLIERGRLTVPGFLRGQGYSTAMIGKWHLGLDWIKTGPRGGDVDFSRAFGGGPTAHGFDSFYGISASLDMPPYVYLSDDRSISVPSATTTNSPRPRMWRAGPIGADFRHEEVQTRFIEKAQAYIKARAEAADHRPFFLYLALAAPHTPIVPTAAFGGRTRTNPYGDFVAQVDAGVGELLVTLDRYGLATNTMVVFTADNGCSPAADLDELRHLKHDPSAGFRGHKADLFEGGHRVPFVVRWPGQVPAGTRCSQPIGQVDLLATCAEILNLTLPDSAGEDSVSILELLRGGEAPPPRREILVHHSFNGSFAVRQGRWKLLLAPDSGGWSEPKPGSSEAAGLPRFQLYDLASDPAETKNLSGDNPDVVRRLGRALWESIERGRSTPGAPRLGSATPFWPQLEWRKDFGE